MNTIKIYGFSGKLGVGKNYVAEKIFGKKLYEKGYNVHILAFGDLVKYELGSRFKKIENNLIYEMTKVYEELFINKSAETRNKLQFYGTNFCRNGENWKIKDNFTMYNEPDIWIKGLLLQINTILERSYDNSKDIFIITDVRFKNEAEFIKKLGGKIIKIDAPIRNYNKLLSEAMKTFKSEKDINDYIERIKNHSSETDLDTYTFDYVIANDINNENDMSIIDDLLNMK